jgi:hypothetical protein
MVSHSEGKYVCQRTTAPSHFVAHIRRLLFPPPSPILELERLNGECESTLSRECSLEAVEARNILKVALGAQAAAARETNSMVAARLFEKERKQKE